MEIRIAQIIVRGDRGFVMYPCPAPSSGPKWMVLDDGGRPVCVDETIDELRGQAPDAFIDELRAAAEAAVVRRAGGALEQRMILTSYPALELAAKLGWLALILPETLVWFPNYTDGPEAGTLATAADLAAGRVPASKRWLEPGCGVRPVAWGAYSTLAKLVKRPK